MRVMQRRGLCEISRYGDDPQCLQRPEFVTCVQRDGRVIRGVDFVCHTHRLLILERKRALCSQYRIRLPFMWVTKIKEGK